MSDRDKLREHAATIMAVLEDAQSAAMDIQSHDATPDDMSAGFREIRRNLTVAANITSDTEKLITALHSE